MPVRKKVKARRSITWKKEGDAPSTSKPQEPLPFVLELSVKPSPTEPSSEAASGATTVAAVPLSTSDPALEPHSLVEDLKPLTSEPSAGATRQTPSADEGHR